MGQSKKSLGLLSIGAMAIIAIGANPGTTQAAYSYMQGGVMVIPRALSATKYRDIGGSRLFDNGDLHLATDDVLYLDAPIRTIVKKDLRVGGNIQVSRNSDGFYTGSQIYDDNNLTLATDDDIYLNAPGSVHVQNNLVVTGSLSITGSFDLGDGTVTMAKLTGVLPIANGGTGSATKNFVDLSTSQTVAGVKTFSSAIVGSLTGNVTGNLTGDVTGNVTGNLTGNVTGNADTATTATTATTANAVAASSVGTAGIAAGAVTGVKLQAAAADLGAANVNINLGNTNGAFNTNIITDGSITASSFSGNLTGNLTGDVTGNVTGNLTGNVTGNADTATTATTATTANAVAASSVGTAGIAAGAVTGVKLQAAAADLGAANVNINLGNTNGAFNTNIITDGSITASSFSGNLTGNLTGDVTGNVTGNLTGNVTGNADTATTATTATTANAVAASSVGTAGIAAGAVTGVKLQAAAADLGAANVNINLGNTNGAFNTNIITDGSITASSFSGNLTGNLTGDVTGNVTGNLTGNVTGNADTATTATTATTANAVAASSVGTAGIAAGAVTGVKLQAAAADLGAANVNINLGNTNGAFNTNIITDGSITASSFSGNLTGNLTGDVTGNVTGNLTGNVTGNADTATTATTATTANAVAASSVGTAGIAAGAVTGVKLQAAAADLGAANVNINLGNTNGAFNTNIITDGSITASSFSGNLTGNVTGNLTGDVTGNVTGNLTGNVTGNADTATTATTATTANAVAASSVGTAGIAAGAVTGVKLQAAAADLGAANVNINLGNTNGAFNTNIITDGSITASSFSSSGEGSFGSLVVTGLATLGRQTFAVVDSGDGSPAADILTPTSSYVEIDCQDTDGCDITMGEAGMTEGNVVTVINISGNDSTFTDTSGVSELSGASFVAGAYDSLSMMYTGDRWVQTSSANN